MSQEICNECCGCGFKIGAPVYDSFTTTAPIVITNTIECKKCKGTGWYNVDEIISVPIKYVKDEYFKK